MIMPTLANVVDTSSLLSQGFTWGAGGGQGGFRLSVTFSILLGTSISTRIAQHQNQHLQVIAFNSFESEVDRSLLQK